MCLWLVIFKKNTWQVNQLSNVDPITNIKISNFDISIKPIFTELDWESPSMVHFQNCLDNPAFNQRWPLLVKIEISLKLSFLIHFLFDWAKI